MKRLVGFALVAAAVVSLPVGARAVTYAVVGTGNWGDPAKWTPSGIPNGTNDTANLSSSATMTLADASGNDASFTLATFSSSPGSVNTTISNVAGGTGSLVFARNGGTASLTTVKNTDKVCNINVRVVLNDNLSVKAQVNSPGVAFNKEISSGIGRTTGLIIASQSGNQTAQSPSDVRIAAAASYTGETRIMGSAVSGTAGSRDGGGKLLLALNNALPVTTILRIDGATLMQGATQSYYPKGGTLKLNGKHQEVAGLYGAAGYDPGKITTTTASTLTINNTADFSFAGMIGGTTPTPISVTKKGAGVQTLSGTNTYSGTTTVEAGTLALVQPGELRFFIQNGGAANSIGGTGAVSLDGVFRLNTNSLTDVKGTWNLVNKATLTASFGSSFTVAFEGGPTFAHRGGGVYTGTDGWRFSTSTGDLTLSASYGTVMLVR